MIICLDCVLQWSRFSDMLKEDLDVHDLATQTQKFNHLNLPPRFMLNLRATSVRTVVVE